MTAFRNCLRKPRGSWSAKARSSGNSSDTCSCPGNVARTSVVFPDCLGPVREITGNWRAARRNALPRILEIMQSAPKQLNLTNSNHRDGMKESSRIAVVSAREDINHAEVPKAAHRPAVRDRQGRPRGPRIRRSPRVPGDRDIRMDHPGRRGSLDPTALSSSVLVGSTLFLKGPGGVPSCDSPISCRSPARSAFH
jgi:hypothetical protein